MSSRIVRDGKGQPYEFIRELGRGGYATTYEAVAPSGAHVAVKHLRYPVEPDEELRRSWIKEGTRLLTTGRFHIYKDTGHPNIVFLNTMFSEGDDHYLVTELCDGTLGQMLDIAGDALGRKNIAGAVAFGVLRALAWIHLAGVAHCDIHEDNILFRQSGPPESILSYTFKLGDWGLSERWWKPERPAERRAAGDVADLAHVLLHVMLGPVAPGATTPPAPERAEHLSEPLRGAVIEALAERHGESAATRMWQSLFAFAPLG